MIDKPGIYKIPHTEYVNDPVIEPSLSRSMIKDLLYSSAHTAWFNNPRLNPNYKEQEESKFDIGSAAHSLLLEGINKVEVIDAEDWRKKEAKEARDKAREDGKIPLLVKQFAEVNKMIDSAKEEIAGCKELWIKDLSTEGDAELTYIWKEDETWIRIRPDWISKDRKLCIDYKTTGQSANPEDIGRHIVSMSYDIQNSLYVRGIKAIEGIESKFVFVFQENFEPYLCSFVALPPEFLEMGKQKVEYGIFKWKQCIESNKWEGYPKQVCYPDTPAWSLANWESIAQRIGV